MEVDPAAPDTLPRTLNMPKQFAAILALIAFALTVVVGVQAGNSFTTTLFRALVAMAGSYVIGLILGFALQRMLEDNLKAQQQKSKDLQPQPQPKDR